MLADIEVVSINLTTEYLDIDSECDLFRKLPPELSSNIERSVYNRRLRRLFPHLERITAKLAGHINANEDRLIIVSMPSRFTSYRGAVGAKYAATPFTVPRTKVTTLHGPHIIVVTSCMVPVRIARLPKYGNQSGIRTRHTRSQGYKGTAQGPYPDRGQRVPVRGISAGPVGGLQNQTGHAHAEQPKELSQTSLYPENG